MAKILHTKWSAETVKALQIYAKSERTRHCYAGAVRMLTQYFGKEPDQITRDELRDYFQYLKND